jgi:hypothetical protein
VTGGQLKSIKKKAHLLKIESGQYVFAKKFFLLPHIFKTLPGLAEPALKVLLQLHYIDENIPSGRKVVKK